MVIDWPLTGKVPTLLLSLSSVPLSLWLLEDRLFGLLTLIAPKEGGWERMIGLFAATVPDAGHQLANYQVGLAVRVPQPILT